MFSVPRFLTTVIATALLMEFEYVDFIRNYPMHWKRSLSLEVINRVAETALILPLGQADAPYTKPLRATRKTQRCGAGGQPCLQGCQEAEGRPRTGGWGRGRHIRADHMGKLSNRAALGSDVGLLPAGWEEPGMKGRCFWLGKQLKMTQVWGSSSPKAVIPEESPTVPGTLLL